jgi:hypothetical protein
VAGLARGAVARGEVEPRGEYVVVVDGADAPPPADDDELAAAVERLVAAGRSTKDAVAEVAATFDVAKRRVYELATAGRSSGEGPRAADDEDGDGEPDEARRRDRPQAHASEERIRASLGRPGQGSQAGNEEEGGEEERGPRIGPDGAEPRTDEGGEDGRRAGSHPAVGVGEPGRHAG